MAETRHNLSLPRRHALMIESCVVFPSKVLADEVGLDAFSADPLPQMLEINKRCYKSTHQQDLGMRPHALRDTIKSVW